MAQRQTNRLWYGVIALGIGALLLGAILTGRWGYLWLGLFVIAAAALPLISRRQ